MNADRIRVTFSSRRIDDETKMVRRMTNRTALDAYQVACIWVDGVNHCGEGETQAQAMRRAAEHWERSSK